MQGRFRYLLIVKTLAASVSRDVGYTQIKLSPNTFHSSDKPLLQFILYFDGLAEGYLLWSLHNHIAILRSREEIHQVNDTLFMYVPRVQDIRRRKVLLFRRAF